MELLAHWFFVSSPYVGLVSYPCVKMVELHWPNFFKIQSWFLGQNGHISFSYKLNRKTVQ